MHYTINLQKTPDKTMVDANINSKYRKNEVYDHILMINIFPLIKFNSEINFYVQTMLN